MSSCQFVVRSDGDYGAYMGDPDMLVDWDMIEQVRVFSSEEVNCPICLSTPVAGKYFYIIVLKFRINLCSVLRM